MKKFFFVIIIVYATILLIVNLNIIPIESFLKPDRNYSKKLRAINLLQKKFKAEVVQQDQNYDESKIIKLMNKPAILSTNVIKLFTIKRTDHLILSVNFSDKNIKILLEYNSKIYWRKFQKPFGNIIAAIKIKKLYKGDELKFLSSLEGIEIPIDKRNVSYFEGEMLEFINI